jgi:uncharacterized protein
LNDQAEVASLVGDIGLMNGAPSVHIRAVVIPEDGIARGGHLLRANVWPTPEILLTDYSTPLMKQLESETELELFS